MRVIRGKYSSRKLDTPDGMDIRPTSDMVKQALFNILGDRVHDADVLELFAGTGQLGIEALSCGARRVVFNDSSNVSKRLTQDNLSKLELSGEIMTTDFRNALSALSGRGESFDLIIADPPYKCGFYPEIQELILQKGLLKQDGVLVLEHDRELPPPVVKGYGVLSARSYGKRSLLLLTNSDGESNT